MIRIMPADYMAQPHGSNSNNNRTADAYMFGSGSGSGSSSNNSAAAGGASGTGGINSSISASMQRLQQMNNSGSVVSIFAARKYVLAPPAYLPKHHPLVGTFSHAPSTGASSAYFKEDMISRTQYLRQREFRMNPYTGALATSSQLHQQLHKRVANLRNCIDNHLPIKGSPFSMWLGAHQLATRGPLKMRRRRSSSVGDSERDAHVTVTGSGTSSTGTGTGTASSKAQRHAGAGAGAGAHGTALHAHNLGGSKPGRRSSKNPLQKLHRTHSDLIKAASSAPAEQSKRLRLATVPPAVTGRDESPLPTANFKSIGVAPAHLDITDSYTLLTDEIIGEGAFGTICLAKPKPLRGRRGKLDASPGLDLGGLAQKVEEPEDDDDSEFDEEVGDFVVKVISKECLVTKEEQQAVVREANIHSRLQHPNIVRLLETYESREAVFLVMERIQGMNLHRYMQRKMTFSETEAAVLAKQLLQAVEYLHANNLVHCDIKPQNVLLVNESPGEGATLGKFSTVKLCDFGSARRATDAKYYKQTGSVSLVPFSVLTGTMGFIAPEVLMHKPFSTQVDLWAIGTLLYELLVGYTPFYPYKDCIDRDVRMKPRYWKSISAEGKDLTKRLLQRDPAKRITAKQALAHPWFRSV